MAVATSPPAAAVDQFGGGGGSHHGGSASYLLQYTSFSYVPLFFTQPLHVRVYAHCTTTVSSRTCCSHFLILLYVLIRCLSFSFTFAFFLSFSPLHVLILFPSYYICLFFQTCASSLTSSPIMLSNIFTSSFLNTRLFVFLSFFGYLLRPLYIKKIQHKKELPVPP